MGTVQVGAVVPEVLYAPDAHRVEVGAVVPEVLYAPDAHRVEVGATVVEVLYSQSRVYARGCTFRNGGEDVAIPLISDRAAYRVTAYPARHSDDLPAHPQYHVPLPGAARNVAISDGTDWTSRALVAADLTGRGTGTAGRVAQFAAGGAAVEDANLVGPAANLLTFAATVPATLTVPETGTAGLLGRAQKWTAANTFDAGPVVIGGSVGTALGKLHVIGNYGSPYYAGFYSDSSITLRRTSGNSPALSMRSGSVYCQTYYNDDDPNPQGAMITQVVGDADAQIVFRNYTAAGRPGFTVDPANGGMFGVNTVNPTAAGEFNVKSASIVGLLINLAATPSEAALEVRASGGAVLANITQTGGATFGDAVVFTQAGTHIDSGAIGYLDYLATTAHRFNSVIRGTSSLWWYCKYIDAFSVSPGASGATEVPPDANTLGGYQLDAATEYLYFNGRVCSNWDGATDLIVTVTWEVNVDNSAGNVADTVDLKLVAYYKGDAEIANKTQTVEVATTVGQSARYKQFTTTFTIDYDLAGNVVDVGDTFSFILNLETDTSEVDDVVINFGTFSYRTAKMNVEA